MTVEDSPMAGYSPRELLLAAAARCVLAAFRDPLERKELPPAANAMLRMLETTLDAYPFGRLDEAGK